MGARVLSAHRVAGWTTEGRQGPLRVFDSDTSMAK
jgi:hypothetical protein